MSRLKPNAQTVILGVPFRDADPWGAGGEDRISAEAAFARMILAGHEPAPAYRVVIQLKVDQHDMPDHLCSPAFH